MRNVTLDVTKVLMAFMVVGIHTNIFYNINSDVSYFLVEGLFRIAVPFFFIINGFFFDRMKGDNNWIKKLAKIYIIWTVFYSALWVENISIDLRGYILLLKYFALGYHHLWYLAALLAILFTLKIVNINNYSIRKIFIISIFLYIIAFSLQYIAKFNIIATDSTFYKLTKYDFLYRNFIFLGFPFFLLGVILSKLSLEEKISKSALFIFLAISFLLLLIEVSFNYTKSIKTTGFDVLLSSYILSPAIFLTCLKFPINKNIYIISFLATAIYLIHPLIISVTDFLLGDTPYFLVLIVSVFISYIICFFPVLRKFLIL